MKQSSEQGSIDDLLFDQLSEFFGMYGCDVKALERMVLSGDYPRHDPKKHRTTPEQYYAGLLLKAHVQQMLSDFARENSSFSPVQVSPGTLENGISFELNGQGRLQFYGNSSVDKDNIENDRRIYTVAEIDALYIWDDGSTKKPIIFNVTYVKDSDRSHKDMAFKRRFGREYFGTNPFICKIRPVQEDEDYVLKKGSKYRRLLIPRQDFNALIDRCIDSDRQLKKYLSQPLVDEQQEEHPAQSVYSNILAKARGLAARIFSFSSS